MTDVVARSSGRETVGGRGGAGALDALFECRDPGEVKIAGS